MKSAHLARFSLMCLSCVAGGLLTGRMVRHSVLTLFEGIAATVLLLFLIQGANAAQWWRIERERGK